MKRYTAPLLIAFLFLLLGSAAARADGKATFEKYKCGACHSITSQGIQKATTAPPPEEAAPGEKKVEPPDLSNVGATRNAQWVEDFINKKADIEGRKHKKRWTGTPEELKELSAWLATLKKP